MASLRGPIVVCWCPCRRYTGWRGCRGWRLQGVRWKSATPCRRPRVSLLLPSVGTWMISFFLVQS
uniref:Uncharacterized protein n=1 Tax=Arundo donax TaxID=35708 RepID=A0A0A9CHW4_ARUDO